VTDLPAEDHKTAGKRERGRKGRLVGVRKRETDRERERERGAESDRENGKGAKET
jgi:hypothetical protein